MGNLTVIDARSLACEIRALAPFRDKTDERFGGIHVLPGARGKPGALGATDNYRLATMPTRAVSGKGVLSGRTVSALLSAIGDTIHPKVLPGKNGSLIVRRGKREIEVPLTEEDGDGIPNLFRLRAYLMEREPKWEFTLPPVMMDSLRNLAKAASLIALDFDERVIEARQEQRRQPWRPVWRTEMPEEARLISRGENTRHRIAFNPSFVADTLAFLKAEARWQVSGPLHAVFANVKILGYGEREVIIMPMREGEGG